MNSRTKHPRKAATTVTYDDPPEFNELDSGSEEDSEESSSGVARKASRGKGKGKQRAKDEDESSDEEEEERAPKKRQTAKGKGKGKGGRKSQKVGKLEVLKTLPVEILLEIFSHLAPPDLVALSVVNKMYRSLLVSPASSSLWKRARESFDVPAISAGGITEHQYAVLMFGKKCQRCGAKASYADFFIRERICKGCRTEKFDRVKNLQLRQDLHPLTLECAMKSFHSPAAEKWSNSTPYADVDHLTYYDKILWELQYEEDSDEEDVDEEDVDDAESADPSASDGRRRHPDGRINYAEWDVEEENVSKVTPSRKAKKFAEERKVLIEAIRAEGAKLECVENEVHRKLAERKREQKLNDWRDNRPNYSRIEDIRARVLALNLGFVNEDFTGRWHTDKLVNSQEALDDGSWDVIKPKIIKLLESTHRKRMKDDDLNRKEARQKVLRTHYNSLKSSLPATARPYLPLFVDFLLLPSVIPLWEEEGDITSEVWADALDEIKEELEEYRVELCSYARDVILEATTDPDEVDVEEEDGLDLSDDFFAKATSYVCCGFKDCHKGHNSSDATQQQPNWYAWRRRGTRIYDSNNVGPLVEVLEHQHKLHNFANSLPKAVTKNSSSHSASFRVHLPLEIACAVSAVVELGNLGPDATKGDLKRADSRGWWEWENSTKRQRRIRVHQGCMGLFRMIKREVDKASKAKPPRSLPPPVVVYHDPHYWQRRIPSDDEDDGGSGSNVKGMSSKSTSIVDSSEEDDSSDEGNDVE